MGGHALIWPGRAIYVGPLLEHDAHAHHAVQISIALEGELSVQAPPAPSWRRSRAVATAPDVTHRLRCPSAVAQVYLDPESSAGLAMRQRIGSAPVLAVEVERRDRLVAALGGAPGGRPDADAIAGFIDDLTETAAPDFSRDLIDPRVQRALTTIHTPTGREMTLRELAARASLSPSRLGALFRRDVGVPIRRYVLWLRLIDAIRAISGGANLTQAAHEAGFSDSSHLSRTFRRMFGMPPSALAAQDVEIHDYAVGGPAAPWWEEAAPPSGKASGPGTAEARRTG